TRKPPSGEHRVWRRIRPDAAGVLALDSFALRSEAELAAVRAAWAAWKATLNDLDKANSAMLDAASGKMKDDDAKKLVLGLAADVEMQATTLKTAMERGRTEP